MLRSAYPVVGGLFTQGAAMGALPTLRAATDPAAAGGQRAIAAPWVNSPPTTG